MFIQAHMCIHVYIYIHICVDQHSNRTKAATVTRHTRLHKERKHSDLEVVACLAYM